MTCSWFACFPFFQHYKVFHTSFHPQMFIPSQPILSTYYSTVVQHPSLIVHFSLSSTFPPLHWLKSQVPRHTWEVSRGTWLPFVKQDPGVCYYSYLHCIWFCICLYLYWYLRLYVFVFFRQNPGSASIPAGVQQGVDGQAGASSGAEGEEGEHFFKRDNIKKNVKTI